MLKMWTVFGTATALIASLAAAATTGDARDPFSGRWRPDTSTLARSNPRLTVKLDDKGFGRSTGTAVETTTPADGNFRSVKGDDYVDSIAVKIISGDEVRETNKLKGRLVYESRYVLTENGQTLTWFVTSFANVTNTAVEVSSTWHRVSSGNNGKHALAGEWRQTGVSTSGDANDWIFKLSANVFSHRSPQGSGYAAQLGGPAVNNEGDLAGATVSVVRPDPYTIVEYHGLKGNVGAVLVLQASEDATTLKAVAVTPKTGEATSFTLRRVVEAP